LSAHCGGASILARNPSGRRRHAQRAYIYDAVRTPRSKGKPGGSLHEVKPIDLGAGLLRALQQRHDLDTAYVDDVVMGCVTPIGEQGSDVTKMIVQNADWDESVAGVQLDRFCASGLEAVNIAAQKVASGWEDLVVAGGIESMSRVPMGSNGGPMSSDPAFAAKTGFVPQGIGADTIATLEGWSREDVDRYAVESQRRAAHAPATAGTSTLPSYPCVTRSGLPILDKRRLHQAEHDPRDLGGLNASFEMIGQFGFDDVIMRKYPVLDHIEHVHTPGNSSGIVDGASAVLVGSEKAGKDLGLTPRARIVATAVLATDPVIMLTGPGPAAKEVPGEGRPEQGRHRPVGDQRGLRFRGPALHEGSRHRPRDHQRQRRCHRHGPPLGATGAMLVGIMLDELERRDLKRGMLSLCVGGGMGISTIIERV
jgi:acetyl-CoA C-acetyltransferase